MAEEALTTKGLVLLYHSGGSDGMIGWQVRGENCGAVCGPGASFGDTDCAQDALAEVQNHISELLGGLMESKIAELRAEIEHSHGRIKRIGEEVYNLKLEILEVKTTKASLAKLSGEKECFDRAVVLLEDVYAVGIREADGEIVVEQFNEGGDRIVT